MAHEWTNGETITAEKLNDIENNIEAQQNTSGRIVLVTTTIDAGQTYSDVSMTSNEIVEYAEDGKHYVHLFVANETPGSYIYGKVYTNWDTHEDDQGVVVTFVDDRDVFNIDAEGHVTFTGK